MPRRLLLTLGFVSCTGEISAPPGPPGAGDATTVDGAGLPCEVSHVLALRCASCHANPPSGGATMPLLSRADLLAPSAIDGTTQASRSVLRMRSATAPMPPGGGVPASELDAFAAWVTAGTPDGTCGPVDGGSTEPTCTAHTFEPRPVDGDAHGGRDMAPGWACIACHAGRDFEGQNPGGRMSRSDQVRDFMGTVFSAPHEQDLCVPTLAVAATVEIFDLSGARVASLPVNAGGNFYGDAAGARPAQYTAQVVTASGVRAMTSPQTDGDCNTCHTVAGREGAPGRIFLP